MCMSECVEVREREKKSYRDKCGSAYIKQLLEKKKNQGKTIRQKRNGRINGTDTETLQKEKKHAHTDNQTGRQ